MIKPRPKGFKFDDTKHKRIWVPNSEPQRRILAYRGMELLIHGGRGSGKSDALLVSFLKAIRLEGRPLRGVIFRPFLTELRELIFRCQNLYGDMFEKQGGRYLKNDNRYMLPDGSELHFRPLYDAMDALTYKGWEYDFIGYDELTSWISMDAYKQMLASTARTKGKNCYIRATTNPDGMCSYEVQQYFKCPQSDNVEIEHTTTINGINYIRKTLSIPLQMKDNPALKEEYIATVHTAAINKGQRDAWVEGIWGTSHGGMFDDLFDADIHILPAITTMPLLLRQGWRIGRSFDWGSAAPFSVGWYLIVPEDCFMEGAKHRLIKDDVIRFAEYYGWNGEPNKGANLSVAQVAEKIHETERKLGIWGKVSLSVADPAILGDAEGYNFGKQFKQYGVHFEKLHIQRHNAIGWDAMRGLLVASADPMRERPGLFVTADCEHFIRTVPRLKRDVKKVEQLAPGQEDHVADEVKVFCMSRRKQLQAKQVKF